MFHENFLTHPIKNIKAISFEHDFQVHWKFQKTLFRNIIIATRKKYTQLLETINFV